jgi:hypothetical protein
MACPADQYPYRSKLNEFAPDGLRFFLELFIEVPLDVTGFFLQLAADAFHSAFGFHVPIIRGSASLLFDVALQFTASTFDLISRAPFHVGKITPEPAGKIGVFTEERGRPRPRSYTSQIRTASASEVTLSRVGMNSCPT